MNKTPHRWVSSQCGYDCTSSCSCGAQTYGGCFGTQYCEDFTEAKRIDDLRKSRSYPPEEQAWEKIRQVLTREEWLLLGFDKKFGRPYRDIDRIVV